MGTTGNIKRFTGSWNRELEKYSLPYFHAKDIRNGRSKLFKHLSESKRERLLSDLSKLIVRYMDRGFSAVVDVDAFSQQTSPRFRSQWGSPYPFAIQLILYCMHLHLNETGKLSQVVNILIEDGHANANAAINHFRESKESESVVLNYGSYSLGGKIGNPILQAADLVAYGSCQIAGGMNSSILDELLNMEKLPIVRIPCNKFIEKIKPVVVEYFNRHKLGLIERLH
jgi:hypothetical protein